MKGLKKFFSLALVTVLLFSLAGGAWAAPKGGGQPGQARGHAERNMEQEHERNMNEGATVEEKEQNQNKEREENGLKKQEKRKSVTEHVYKGIENALQHVKNPVARAALEAIMEGKSVPEAVYQAKQSLKDWHDLVEVTVVAEELKEALEEDGSIDRLTRAECYKHLGEMLVEAGKMQDARSLLEQALKNNPGDDENYIILNKVFAKVKDSKIKVYIKGNMPMFDVAPVVENGRVLVPLRVLAESLGAAVDYKDNTINIQLNNSTVKLVVGSGKALVDGKPVMLEVPARVVDGRALVPLRFIGEGLKAKVNYYREGNLVAVE
ncbi:tetratricopeptide (TPR) repeat protein [Desulfofundulus luciae]|uniref:Tetratricopeptide (TPR) repeat protein n=1 Tax=Desulfofundulus luciae TaxID=74702 RepID=A0ABU0B2C2_9FIRM|nr:copper amine oxidase N-terminal domain-containing protein [Desulfofundulus luciae]MDQ0286872.1 tetratricopeptide (TPR) repeat protein [Desulfofundulus luciae]